MCYNFRKVFINNNNSFQESTDATYIIHLKNNGRYDNILKQLKFFQPTEIVYILINEGYKNCNKNPTITSTNLDLIDCYTHIIQHANNNNYGNILILEDDFIFSDKIKDTNITDEINTYIKKNEDSQILYFLGYLPFLQYPVLGTNHNSLLLHLGTHAVIYSKGFVKNFENNSLETSLKIDNWDDYLKKYKRIGYNTPLCYQLFTPTDNYKNWGDNYTTKLTKYIIKNFGLDKNVEPGYTKWYMYSKIIFFILLLFILIFVITILRYISKLI